LAGKPERKRPLADLGVDGENIAINLKGIVRTAWIGFIWLLVVEML
jgi:hypothetical protein